MSTVCLDDYSQGRQRSCLQHEIRYVKSKVDVNDIALILFVYMYVPVLFFVTCTAIAGRRFSVCSSHLPLCYSSAQSSESTQDP